MICFPVTIQTEEEKGSDKEDDEEMKALVKALLSHEGDY